MVWKTSPTISQSSVKLLTKKAIPFRLVPSNSVYFRRYPYKVVFDIHAQNDKPWLLQLMTFKSDLTVFIEDILKKPTRQYMSCQNPSMFIQDYTDLKTTLAVYKDYITEIHGPTSQEHLDLLYSSNFKCQSKDKLWYNLYDCKVELWLPFKYRPYSNQSVPDEETTETHNLINYMKDNLNLHVPKSWAGQHSTTVYCRFNEFLEIYPFIKLSYPKHRIDITQAVLNSK
jgi:hypothetical protein